MKKFRNLMFILFLALTSIASYAENIPKILIVLTSHSQLGDTGKRAGFWLSELTHPYYRFKAEGYLVDIASPLGGMAPMEPKSFDEPDEANQRFLQDAQLMAKVIRTLPLAKINPDNYKAVVFAGGSGPMWDFPGNEHINRVAASIYESKGIVSAICHGPAALIDIKLSNNEYLISGRKVTAITNEEEKDLNQMQILPFLLQDKLVERGAQHIPGKPWQENVVEDGRLITGQNPASAIKVAERIIKYIQAN